MNNTALWATQNTVMNMKNKIIQTQARGSVSEGSRGSVQSVIYFLIFNISIVGARQSNVCVIKQKIVFISAIYSFLQDRARKCEGISVHNKKTKFCQIKIVSRL